MAGRGGGGRIRSHERDADDSVAILGANLQILVEHSQEVRITEQLGLDRTTKRNYIPWCTIRSSCSQQSAGYLGILSQELRC